MASQIGHQTDPIKAHLCSAHKYDFFQWVRNFHLLNNDCIDDHLTYYRTNNSLSFPDNNIQQAELDSSNKAIVTINFMGLTGSNAILPMHFTEEVIKNISNKNYSLNDFLNIFNNHLINLYYKSWRAGHYYLYYERDSNDQQQANLLTLSALTGKQYTNFDYALLDKHLLYYYSGLFAQKITCAENLRHLLNDYFKLPFSIEQYHGKWINICEEDSSRLANNANNQLGTNTLLGKTIWHVKNQFQLIVGKLTYNQYKQTLPNGKLYKAIKQIVDLYVGDELNCDLTLLINNTALPLCQLSSSKPIQLGWNACLHNKQSKQQLLRITPYLSTINNMENAL